VKSKLLDFLVIGAAKSGTTSLFHYLRPHPRIYLPPEKEISFFSNEEWFARGWDEFVGEFFGGAPADVQWGKVTPHYMAYPHVPKRIFDLMPKVKLIALLRNPVDRAFSHYRMAVRTAGERRTFEQVISDLSEPNATSFLRLGEYGRIIGSFAKHFPSEQLQISFAEDLEQRPKFVVDSILTYLGLDPGFSPRNLGERYHQGGVRQRFPWLIPAARRISPLWRLWRALPENRRRVLRFWFHTQINTIVEPAPEIDANLRCKLVEFYRPDVLELERLILNKVPWKEFHLT
jgi:hypothetical protein